MIQLLGVFAECNTEEDQKRYARQNAFLFYELGAFAVLVQLLSMEVEYVDCFLFSGSSVSLKIFEFNCRISKLWKRTPVL